MGCLGNPFFGQPSEEDVSFHPGLFGEKPVVAEQAGETLVIFSEPCSVRTHAVKGGHRTKVTKRPTVSA